MADFLDAKVKEINERLKELRPLVEEYHRLEAAAAALAGAANNGGGRSTATTTRRTRRAASSGGGTGRRGRRKGSGTRAREALEIVRARPGISIRELAEAMNIAPNYLYRVMPTLEGEGQVRKEGSGWHAA